jgi:hypothetical protein
VCRNFEPAAGQLASTVRTRFVPTTQSAYRLPSDRTLALANMGDCDDSLPSR